MMSETPSERLHVFMARCGTGSRRGCEQIIREGRVAVNGEQVTRMGFTITREDVVTVDGKPIRPVRRKFYLALYKPPGYLCSNSDPHGRPLAKDLLGDMRNTRLFHVGRLDFMSSGIIFYTNDGEFAHRISHPSFEISKEYRVDTADPVDEADLERYRQGVTLDGFRYRIVRFRLHKPTVTYLELVEGKNREIRRVFRHLGYTVNQVHRVRIGNVNVRGLASGEYRHLRQSEVEWFMNKSGAVPR